MRYLHHREPFFFRRSVLRSVWACLSVLLAVSQMAAQNEILYGDWIDSAEVARSNNGLRSAQRFYHAAFKRQPALLKHAMDCARIGWMLHDTIDARMCVDRALDLGESGDVIATDSILGSYWRSPVSEESHTRWATFRAMELPELKAELEQMFIEDQSIRMALDQAKAESPDSLVRRSAWAPVEALDAVHTKRVIAIIGEHGVPSVHQVGLTGNKMIFFAFIHAADVQVISDHVLLLSKSVRKGDSPACWYAYVIDRLMVKTSKETMFGTTGYTDRIDGVTYFTPVVSLHVDLLREAMGIPRMSKGRSFY